MGRLIQLPPEILGNILTFVDPQELARVRSVCRYLNGFVKGNSTLHKEIYYRLLDEPPSENGPLDWERELQDYERLRLICASQDPTKVGIIGVSYNSPPSSFNLDLTSRTRKHRNSSSWPTPHYAYSRMPLGHHGRPSLRRTRRITRPILARPPSLPPGTPHFSVTFSATNEIQMVSTERSSLRAPPSSTASACACTLG